MEQTKRIPNKIYEKAINGGYVDNDANDTERILNPLFFQTLGKAYGWYEEGELVYLVTSGMNNTQAMIHVEDNLGVPLRSTALGVVYLPYTRGKQGWKTIALRFHEINLTEGWDAAIKYLSDLTTS